VPHFVSEPISPVPGSVEPSSGGEPALPAAFKWKDDELVVSSLIRTWRGTKVDRGDTYLKRHWFEFETSDNRLAVVYFDRQAKRGAARWWLYSIGTRPSEVRP
jgi:hypothetical protein